MPPSAQLFISYAREDAEVAREIRDFSSQFLQDTSWWDDSKINPGDEWDVKIAAGMESSHGAVVLISHYSLASEYIWSREVPYFRSCKKPVTWLVIRACPWDKSNRSAALAGLQALVNPTREPICSLGTGHRETLLTEITLKLQHWSQGLGSQEAHPSEVNSPPLLPTALDNSQRPAKPKRRFESRPLFGRNEERNQVSVALDKVADDNIGRGLLISGEAGLGKTALVEFAMHEAAQKGYEVISTSCESFHEGISFFCVKEILRQVAGPKGVLSSIQGFFGHSSSEASLAEIAQDAGSESTNKKEAVIATFSNLVFASAASLRQPLLLVIDDLEKIDVGSVDALLCLVARFREGPVLLIGAIRSDFALQNSAGSNPLKALISQSKRREKGLDHLELQRISEPMLPELVSFFLQGSARLPAAFFRRLYVETDGNPLYVKEVLASLSSHKIYGDEPPLRRDHDSWVFLRTGKEWEIPNSIEDAVALTLQELSQEQRGVLDAASVIGKRWSLNLVCHLLVKSEDDVIDAVEDLLTNGTLKDVDRSGEFFEFKHSKIRDVIYHQLSSIKKRRNHIKVAEKLTEKTQSSISRDSSVLVARHFFLGGKYQESLPMLIAAGNSALQNSAGSEATSLFMLAKEAAEQLDLPQSTLGEIDLHLGTALKMTVEYEAAETAFNRVIQGGYGAASIHGSAMCNLADIHVVRGRFAAAENCYRSAETIALEHALFELASECAAGLSELHMRQYEKLSGVNKEQALIHHGEYLRYLNLEEKYTAKTDKKELTARCLRNRAKKERTLGNLPAAIRLYEESIALQEKGFFSHRFYIPYAKCLRLVGRFDEARKCVELVLEWGRQIGSARSEAIARQYLGLIFFELALRDGGAMDVARSELNRALAMHEQIGFVNGFQETSVILAEVAIQSKDIALARKHLSKAFDSVNTELGELIVAAADQLAANGEVERSDKLKASVLWVV